MILGDKDLIGASLFILSNHQLEEHVCPCAVLVGWVVSWSYFDPVCLQEAYWYEVSSPLCASIINVLELSDNSHNQFVLWVIAWQHTHTDKHLFREWVLLRSFEDPHVKCKMYLNNPRVHAQFKTYFPVFSNVCEITTNNVTSVPLNKCAPCLIQLGDCVLN